MSTPLDDDDFLGVATDPRWANQGWLDGWRLSDEAAIRAIDESHLGNGVSLVESLEALCAHNAGAAPADPAAARKPARRKDVGGTTMWG